MTMTGESNLFKFVLNENIALRRQLSEMEDFLQDHGLVWVGTSEKEDRYRYSISYHSFFFLVQESLAERKPWLWFLRA